MWLEKFVGGVLSEVAEWKLESEIQQVIQGEYAQRENSELQEMWRKKFKVVISPMFNVHVICTQGTVSTCWKWEVVMHHIEKSRF